MEKDYRDRKVLVEVLTRQRIKWGGNFLFLNGLKNVYSCQLWWHTLVTPTSLEAEAGKF